MFSSVMRAGLTMASYAMSSVFTTKAAAFVTTNLRNAAKVYRANESIAVPNRVSGAIVNSIERMVGPNPGSGLVAKAMTQADRGIKARLPGRLQNTYAAAKQVVKDEAKFLPANYLWYRVEKQAAITPEDKQDTRSFASYYLGPRMGISMASGFAMNHLPNMQRLVGRAIGSMPTAHKEKMISGYASFAKGVTAAAEKMTQVSNAYRTATGGRGLISVLGPKLPQAARTFAKELTAGGERYRSMQLKRLQNPEQHASNAFGATVMEQVRKLELVAAKKEAQFKPGMNVNERGMVQLNQTHQNMLSTVITSYNASASRGSVFTRFWNTHVAKDSSEHITYTKHDVQDKSFYRGKIVQDPSRIEFNGKNYNLGSMSSAYIKDAVIGQSLKGIPAFVNRMFGTYDALEYQRMASSYGSAFTEFSRKGNLVFPSKLIYDNERPLDVVKRMMVVDESVSPKDRDILARRFVRNRVDMYNAHPDFAGMNSKERREVLAASGTTILGRSLQHGTLPVGNKDLLVHMPGGKMYLYADMKGTGADTDMITLDLGRVHPDINDLSYLKYTSQRNKTTDAMRYFVGKDRVTVFGKTSGAQTIGVGPSFSGSVDLSRPADSFTEQLGRRLEMNQGSNTSAFTKLGSVFRKFTSLATPSVLYSKVGLESESTRAMLVNSVGTPGQDAYMRDLLGVVRDNTRELWDKFYVKARDLGQATSLIDSATIRYNDSFDFASDRISHTVEGVLRDGKPHIDSIENYMIDDLQNLTRVRELLMEGSAAPYAGSILTKTKSDRSTGIFGNLSVFDAVNSTILKRTVESSETYAESLSNTITNPKLRHLYDAARHASSLEQGIGYAYSRMAPVMTDGAVDEVRASVDSTIRSLIGPTNKDYTNFRTALLSGTKHKPYLWSNVDSRPTIGDHDWRDTFLITAQDKLGIVRQRSVDHGNGTRSELPEGILGMGNMATMTLLHSFNRVGNETFGIGFNEATTSTPGKYAWKMLSKRIAPAVGIYLGYQAADRLTDYTLDGTPFGEGIGVFAANAYANLRTGAQGIFDMTGITGSAKWMEDVLPGSISSPMSGAIRGVGPTVAGLSLGYASGGPGGALRGGIIGGAVSMLLGGGPLGLFGDWDISKNRKELVQEMTGEDLVSVRSGRWWELSSGPFEGGRISYFRPHMYTMLRGKADRAPGFKESLFDEAVGFIAPDYFGLKNYYSRPYPVTAGLLSNIPIVSSVAAMLPGMPLGGGITMHENELSPEYMRAQQNRYGMGDQYAPAASPLEYGQTAGTGSVSAQMSGQGGWYAGETPVAPSSFESGVGSSIASMRDIVGLRGFMSGLAFEGITGRKDYFDYAPEMATPADVQSLPKMFYETQLGGMLGMNEAIRRYMPSGRAQMEIFNPISNAMPMWMPGAEYFKDFKHGDPYTSVDYGEARLPGRGYDTVHNVSYEMPIDSELSGMDRDAQIAYLLGFPEFMQPYNRQMERAQALGEDYVRHATNTGQIIKADAMLYNPAMDMSATANAVVRSPNGGSVALKVAPKGMNGEHSLNTFLAMGDIEYGQLIEVDPDSGETTERMIRRDMRMFQNDMRDAQAARVAAAQALPDLTESGKAMTLGNAYSHTDRLRILGDVAPYSAAFRREKSIVQQQAIAGTLTPTQSADITATLSQVEQKRQAVPFDEYKFLNLGDSLTPYGKARDAKTMANYSLSERTVGAMWERMTHLRNPLQVKLYQNADALELYEANVIYGKGMKMWDNPVEDYLSTYGYEMAGARDAAQGASLWGSAGVVVGALMGGAPLQLGAMMAGIGAGVGGINDLSGSAFIPQRTKDTRDVMQQYDAVLYAKYQKLYQETGNPEYQKRAQQTMTGSLSTGALMDVDQLSRNGYRPDKDYLSSIINNVTTKNLDRVRAILPAYALPTLDASIGNVTAASADLEVAARNYTSRSLPGLESSMYDPNIPDPYLAIQEFEQRGMNAHDVGMGWYKQLNDINRMREYGLMSKDMSLFPTSESRVKVVDFMGGVNQQNTIRSALQAYGSQVTVENDGRDYVEVELVIRR